MLAAAFFYHSLIHLMQAGFVMWMNDDTTVAAADLHSLACA